MPASPPPPSPPPPPSTRAARLLREVLTDAGFDEPGLTALLGAPERRLAPAEQQALWRWRAREETPLAVLARLFLLQRPVPWETAFMALGEDLEIANALGLVRADGPMVEPLIQLAVHEGLVLASDAASVNRPPRTSRSDHRHLAARRPGRATPVPAGARPRYGGGRPGPAARGRCRSVVATDVSSRALGFARFNAALNGVPVGAGRRLEVLRSDRFRALGGRRFNLVVGNLPFRVSPGLHFVYRDGGAPGDAFVSAVVRETGRRLVEGGLAQYLVQWAHVGDEPEDQRLAPWVVEAGCDALVMRFETEPADVYAARWSAGPGAPDDNQRVRRVREWTAFYRREGIRAVSTGLLTLRRRTAPRHFLVIDEVPPAARPTGDDVLARLAALDAKARGPRRRRA